MKRALAFPGQGSQRVGMGQDLAAAFASAREVFEEVDDALDRGLWRLMREGPAEELELTENAQPALMAVSLAVMEVLRRDAGLGAQDMAALAAGHSLGEYSALTATGALAIAASARLLRRRGRAMQEAAPPGTGAMAALLGMDAADADAVAAEAAEAAGKGQVCALANDNAPGQAVVSGHRAAVELAMELARKRGARRAMLLPVSAPFHCPLMAPAAEVMEEALAGADLQTPAIAVVSNVSARPVSNPAQIRPLLVRQVTATVRWRESIGFMVEEENVEELVEIGAGKVLTGLIKRISPSVSTRTVGAPAEVEEFLKVL